MFLSVLNLNSFCFRGTYRLSDVIDSARPESLQIIRELQTKIQPDDGCVIQFSSVSPLTIAIEDSCFLGCCVTWSKIIRPRTGKIKIIPFKLDPFRYHTLVPAAVLLSEALLELSLWNSQQMRHRVPCYLVHVLNPIPLQQRFHVWEEKKRRHTSPWPVKRGPAPIMGSDV
jgi:hypothetical protein